MRWQRRSRRRAPGGRWPALWIAATAGLLVLTIVSSPSTSFSTGYVDRAQTFAVVADPNAALALENSVAMHTGETCRLVNVTNNLDTALTVTVTLRGDSRKYGDLTVGDGQRGDEVVFTLAAGAEERVDLDVAADASYDGARVFYHVNATAPALHVVATDRFSTIDNSSNATGCTTAV